MRMNIWNKIIIGAISAIVIAVLYVPSVRSEEKNNPPVSQDSLKLIQLKPGNLPKLIDLGSKSCIPCKKMAPILEEMKVAYKDRADVVFIDVNEDRPATLKYKVTLIPTQIFFDTTGTEVFRHVGFFPADSITSHFKALGVK